jgi:hypothetical protein
MSQTDEPPVAPPLASPNPQEENDDREAIPVNPNEVTTATTNPADNEAADVIEADVSTSVLLHILS